MKKILSLLFLSLVLVSCTSKDELFAKKQECVSHSKKMLELAQSFLGESSNGTIGEIFYSEKGNSCYFSVVNRNGQFLFDYFSQKLVAANNPILTEECLKDKECGAHNEFNYEQYNKTFRELKGE